MKTANMWFVGRWISVSDQLPEPETVVLACFDNGEVSSVWQDWKNSDDPFTYIGFPNEDAQTVTHWMPLPDPAVKNTSALPKKFGSTLLLIAPNFSQMRSGMEEIEKLIARCAQTANQVIEQLKAERDAAVADIRLAYTSYVGECQTCKFVKDQVECDNPFGCGHCGEEKCKCNSCDNDYSNWQWRGVQKEEAK